jgi:hypothetical protein
MSKCNLCDRADNLTPHPFMRDGFLCPDHPVKPKQLSIVIPPAPITGMVIIDFNELIGLRAEKLLSLRTYIYLALRVDGYRGEMQLLKMNKFCTRWGVRETDVIQVIANLSGRGIVKSTFTVKTSAITHADRIEEMEAAYASGD